MDRQQHRRDRADRARTASWCRRDRGVHRGGDQGDPASGGQAGAALHEEATRRSGAKHPLVVGDRLDTDIEGANGVGAPSLLVLTGVATLAELVGAGPVHRPTYLSADLRGLLRPASGVTLEGSLGPLRRVDVRGAGRRPDLARQVQPRVTTASTRFGRGLALAWSAGRCRPAVVGQPGARCRRDAKRWRGQSIPRSRIMSSTLASILSRPSAQALANGSSPLVTRQQVVAGDGQPDLRVVQRLVGDVEQRTARAAGRRTSCPDRRCGRRRVRSGAWRFRRQASTPSRRLARLRSAASHCLFGRHHLGVCHRTGWRSGRAASPERVRLRAYPAGRRRNRRRAKRDIRRQRRCRGPRSR